MTTRELIQAEIAKVPEEKLEELYGLIHRFTPSTSRTPQPPDSSILDAFLCGMGSVLEFYPPPERFDIYRFSRVGSLEEWSNAVRASLAELWEEGSERETLP
jgi:hypothetical protein